MEHFFIIREGKINICVSDTLLMLKFDRRFSPEIGQTLVPITATLMDKHESKDNGTTGIRPCIHQRRWNFHCWLEHIRAGVASDSVVAFAQNSVFHRISFFGVPATILLLAQGNHMTERYLTPLNFHLPPEAYVLVERQHRTHKKFHTRQPDCYLTLVVPFTDTMIKVCLDFSLNKLTFELTL